MVRKELVRCFQCGAFLRKEIAESYQKMRERASDAPAPTLREIAAESKASTKATANSESLPPLADDDDFALGAGVRAVSPGQTTSETMIKEVDGTYSLNPVETPKTAATLPDLDASSAAQKSSVSAPPPDDVPHSEATAGELLLNIAKAEEEESEGRRKLRGKKKGSGRGGFIIFCPWGHQIVVQERHRGQVGKCPRCKAQFIVPTANFEDEPAASGPATSAEEKQEATAVESAGALAPGRFNRWITDVHIHSLDPVKLKLKPGSLESAFELYDLGFGVDGILLLQLVKKGSLFSSSEKKKPEVRDAAVAHLAAGKPLSELTVAAQRLFAADSVNQIQVVQPAQYAHESMFAGIPVFGNHRIAVRLPKPADGNELLFASFWLSGFREFVKQMSEVFQVMDLADNLDIPLNDKFADYKCHYTDAAFQALEGVGYYQSDPAIRLKIAGHKCQGCGLVISEDGRKKEKLGGPDGKGLAKAKCPKCKNKFGSNTLYMLATADNAASAPVSGATAN
jgi:phage FluMu protein Com